MGLLARKIAGFALAPVAAVHDGGAVAAILADGRTLVVEAGTQHRKNFRLSAYPILAFLTRVRVIISTGILYLQDQLYH